MPTWEGTLAPPGEYDGTCASVGPPESTTKRQIDRFSCFCTSHGRKSLCFTMGAPFPKNCSFPRGIWTPSNTRFLRPIRAHKPNGISIGSVVFAQMTIQCPYTLQWDAPFPSENCPFIWGIWILSNTWFPGPTRVLNSNGISIGSAVLAGLTNVTDRQTDRQTTLLGR